MSFTLSLNTNPLVNRFADPDDLIETMAYGIGLRDVQLTHEFVNPAWPAALVNKMAKRFHAAMARTGVRITSGMTGPSGRLSHFGHPDAEVRRFYVDWFKTFASTLADLGAKSIGTQFSILTLRDDADPARREELIKIALECWAEIAEHARNSGRPSLYCEPRSVARDFGHTIEEGRVLQARIDGAGLSIPLEMLVDIDHGDVTSDDPADTDPYAWAEAFPRRSPIIHIKQSSMNKGGHWPFTAAYNREGRIEPEKLIEAIRRGGGTDNEICLELSFREREPTDSRVVEMIRESVDYWAPYVETGRADLSAGPS